MEFFTVKVSDRLPGLIEVAHLHEGEAAWLPSVTISDHVDAFHRTILREGCVQVLLTSLKAQVSNKDVHVWSSQRVSVRLR